GAAVSLATTARGVAQRVDQTERVIWSELPAHWRRALTLPLSRSAAKCTEGDRDRIPARVTELMWKEGIRQGVVVPGEAADDRLTVSQQNRRRLSHEDSSDSESEDESSSGVPPSPPSSFGDRSPTLRITSPSQRLRQVQGRAALSVELAANEAQIRYSRYRDFGKRWRERTASNAV
ncbi:hypothetical protein KIPB_015401, partial [Kipferlia bialata]